MTADNVLQWRRITVICDAFLGELRKEEKD